MSNPRRMMNAYLSNQLVAYSPYQRLLFTFDHAIKACHEQDDLRLSKALMLLRCAEYGEDAELAEGMRVLLDHCESSCRAGQFAVCADCLGTLRQLFAEIPR